MTISVIRVNKSRNIWEMKRNESKDTTLKMFNDQYSKKKKIRKEIMIGLNQVTSHIHNKMCY